MEHRALAAGHPAARRGDRPDLPLGAAPASALVVVDVLRRDRRRRPARAGHGRAQPLLPVQLDVRLDLRSAGGHHRARVLDVRDIHRAAGRRRACRPTRSSAGERGHGRQRAASRPVQNGGSPPPRKTRSLGAGARDDGRHGRTSGPRRHRAYRDPSAQRSRGSSACPRPRATRSRSCATATQIFPAMLESIAGARRTVDLLTFVYWRGEVGTWFAEALSERARAGLRVRVLLDGFGALSIEKTLLDADERGGSAGPLVSPAWRACRPHKANHRTHRKVLIVDEEVGFTGGVGIADEWKGDARNDREWRDTHFRIRGPAVDGLRAAFLDNWVETDDVLFERADRPFPRSAAAGVDRDPGRARRFRGRMERHLHAVPRAAGPGAGARPDHDGLLRSGRPAERPAVRRGGARRARSRSSCRVPTPTSGSCSSRASRRTRVFWRAASASGTSSRRCCTRRS